MESGCLKCHFCLINLLLLLSVYRSFSTTTSLHLQPTATLSAELELSNQFLEVKHSVYTAQQRGSS